MSPYAGQSGSTDHRGDRTLERWALGVGLLVLAASAEFVAGILGGVAGLLAALVLGVGATLLWFAFKLPGGRVWLVPLLLAAAVLVPSLVLELAFHSSFAQLFAFVAAGLGSAATVAVSLRQRVRCSLCQRALASGSLLFRCPRCSQVVCEETCWSFEHRRCALCLEQRVPVLPTESSWWVRTAGPRVTQGRCSHCLAAADAADLRGCPRCRRPQCRDCWDFLTGECARCGEALADLPPSLGSIVENAGAP